jgi:hypothetical protein
MARVPSGEKPAKKGQISFHLPPFKMFLFLKKESAHAQASGDASAAPKPSQRHRDRPPYRAMKQITARGSVKAEYATIDCNETTIATASDRKTRS